MIEKSKELKEVYEILKFFPTSELNKISPEFLDFIEANMDNEYEFEWSEEKEFNENTVLPETITLMQMIFLNYYASEDEKEEIKKILDENEKEFQINAYEKYNSNDIFKNRKEIKQTESEVSNQLTNYKEGVFKRIINSILNIFRRK